MNNRLYCVIETKKRELDSRIYFAIKASESNWSVVIGKKSTLFNNSNLLKQGIYLFKSLGPKNYKNIKKVKKYGHKVVALDEEGLTISNSEFVKKRIDENCLKNIEFFFMWGERQKTINLKVWKSYEKKMISSGLSRADILQNSFKNYIKFEANKIKKKYGDFILLTTKFPKYNYPENLLLKRDGSVYEGLHDKQADIQKKNLEEFLDFLDIYSKKFHNKKLILRPHPGEDVQFWKHAIKKFKNVTLILDDKSTCYWIMASKLLISCNCYTSFESYMLGKVSINYSPCDDDVHDYDLIKAVSYNISSQDKLLSYLENYYKTGEKVEDNNFDYVTADKIMSEYIYNYKKKDSDEIILKYLNKINLEYDKRKSDLKSNKFYFNYFKIVKKFKNFYHSYLNKNNPGLVRLLNNKFPSLTLSELDSKIKEIMISLNLVKSDFKIDEIYPGVFLIEKNK